MKTRYYLILLLTTCEGVSADEQTNIIMSTNAPCSPAIGINYGNVSVNCTDPVLEAKVRSLPDLSDYNTNMSQLAKLGEDAKNIEEKLHQMELDTHANSEDVDQLSERLSLAEAQYSRLYQQHSQLSSQLASALAQIPEIIQTEISASTLGINASIAESILDQQFQKYSKNIFFKVDNRLNSQRNRLDNLERRVDALENDVSFLMREYLDGRLQKNVGFFGLSIGGLYISEEWQSRIGIEYELLIPKAPIIGSRGSVYIELAKLDWTEARQYQTLPGIDPIDVVDDHKLTLLNLGSRLFIPGWTEDLRSYLGVSFGHTLAGDEDTFNYGIGIGTEYFRSGTRVAFEVRWEGFSNIEREEITFNPLGNASVTTISESRSGWYAGVKIAFR